MKQQDVKSILDQERANPPKTTQEALERLPRLLRNLEFVAPNHEWNFLHTGRSKEPGAFFFAKKAYDECGTFGCAIGVAMIAWGDEVRKYLDADCSHPDPTPEQNRALREMFLTAYAGRVPLEDSDWTKVTTENVAKRIENYLAGEDIFKDEA